MQIPNSNINICEAPEKNVVFSWYSSFVDRRGHVKHPKILKASHIAIIFFGPNVANETNVLSPKRPIAELADRNVRFRCLRRTSYPTNQMNSQSLLRWWIKLENRKIENEM